MSLETVKENKIINSNKQPGFEFIDKVGVEIEGGWNYSRDDLIADGSIHRGHFFSSVVVGELVSKPMSSLESIHIFIGKNWPTEVNPRCGFHVHVSFKNINFYAACMNSNFYKEFLQAMEQWGKDYPCKNPNFWERLNNENRFCTRTFNPDAQVKLTGKNEARYTQLNYCYAFHKTIECRLFPGFKDYRTAQSAVKAFVEFIENYLKNHPINEETLKESLTDEESETIVNEIEIEETPTPFKEIKFNLFQYRNNNRNVF